MLKVVQFPVTVILKSKKNVLIFFLIFWRWEVSVLSKFLSLLHVEYCLCITNGLFVWYCTLICIVLNTEEFRNLRWN